MTTIVLIGGESNTGKTALIDALIASYPNVFARPISYTSRRRRERDISDEYRYISRAEMITKNAEGSFLNFDEVYGEYYAMDKESLHSIWKSGKVAIKEIHPKNQGSKVYDSLETIKVLIKPLNMQTRHADSDRKSQDTSYYSVLDESIFDIVFYNNLDISPRRNARYLAMKIFCYLKYKTFYPPSSEIDALNRKGYSLVANEFTEEKRVTTANFHQLSADFFVLSIKQYVQPYSNVLEIGPGRGWLRNLFTWPDIYYTSVDISEEMGREFISSSFLVSSIRALPIREEAFDCVVASLADPYLYPEALCEINRVVSNGGYLIISLPAEEWALGIRGKVNKTRFILQSSVSSETYSFTYSRQELEELMSSCGFATISIDEITGEKLMMRESISDAITLSAENLRKKISDLKIVTVGIFQKKEK